MLANRHIAPPEEVRHPHGCQVDLRDLVLRYPVGPFVRGSLKTSLFTLAGHQPLEGRVTRDYVTALDGVSLTITRGERIGVIGANGAGKSTILKTIAGIYPIESGRIETHGRIQSLFNIGLGFEPDATGRENILYRGLAMGRTPKEIAAQIEDIIAFADIGQFIDMPVRIYSAGMYVRLAFTISTFLEGDILLVDEVFGAGDEAFQRKALRRMHDLMDKAGIVVMVGHDMKVIRDISSRVIWLDQGKIKLDGPPAQVVNTYLNSHG